ncbi:hypothetical protein HN419_05315 [Candidatus Woesearchaeota archaeon]|jgi:hypothetical protein|nr:hypothetical protein [Candidatus Woesearchaeota archaeon]MBT3537709.1 hypothetical protein [Candidatus Woesearchaeota archaeon]MBT4697840.1 hypothetical protein [Candidatus Woesearchaeota archaeon]MBT4717500.1 hypothetical protein [Candidatus Woesearchaeota archaeon]MBT7105378.1 hypothetical protein [Candidatus Woesearchaeota archaeon]
MTKSTKTIDIICPKCSASHESELSSEEVTQLKSGETILVYCLECNNEIQIDGSDLGSISSVDKAIHDEISELDSCSGAEIVLIIAGVIGLFYYIIPGLVLFAIAALVGRSRKNRITDLKHKLSFYKTPTSDKSSSDPLKILDVKLAEGKITEKEYLRKKKLLTKHK